MKITAIIYVYNEEKRIENSLKNFLWCDELIVIDRNSTDKTRDIASIYTKNIFTINNIEYKPSDNEIWLQKITTPWVIGFTASDIIHPGLAYIIKNLIQDENFDFDILKIPFKRFVLGLETKRSPWYSEYNSKMVFKHSVARINYNEVHGAIELVSNKVYEINSNIGFHMYHLTHVNVDIMMERNLNYCKAEGKFFPKTWHIKKSLNALFRALYLVFSKEKHF